MNKLNHLQLEKLLLVTAQNLVATAHSRASCGDSVIVARNHNSSAKERTYSVQENDESGWECLKQKTIHKFVSVFFFLHKLSSRQLFQRED